MKGPQKRFYTFYCNDRLSGFDDRDLYCFEQRETDIVLKEKRNLLTEYNKNQTFYSTILNEKKSIYINIAA